MLWPKKELFWAFLKLSTIPANLSREIKVLIISILLILQAQCSSLTFEGHWSSSNLKSSKLREIKQNKTVVHHITTT